MFIDPLRDGLLTTEEKWAMDSAIASYIMQYGKPPQYILLFDEKPTDNWSAPVFVYQGVAVYEYGRDLMQLEPNCVYATDDHRPYHEAVQVRIRSDKDICYHYWKEYTGLVDKYEYCENCDEKRR